MLNSALNSTSPLAAGRPASRLPVLLFGFAALLLTLLSAALIGLGALAPLAVLYGTAIFVAAILFGLIEASQRRMTHLFALVLVLTLVQPPVNQALGLPIGYLFEALCFTFLLGAAITAWRRYSQVPLFRVIALAATLYFVLALLSTLLGRSKPLAALWQLQYNLKLPAMFLIGMLMAFDAAQERWLLRFLKWAWLPIVAFVLLEIVAPGRYERLMRLPLDHTLNPILGIGMRRAGPFQHSGLLALAAAMLCWGCLLVAWSRRAWGWLLPAAVYLLLLLLSGQRQETLAFAIMLCCLAAYVLRHQWRLLLVLGVLLAGLGAVGAQVLNLKIVQKIEEKWGAGTGLEPVSERAELTRAGTAIAKRWAPLGSGLGTFGGAGAQKFDLSQFKDYGFDKHWWFQRGLFLIDVYWPSVAAEAGFAGAAAWLLALLAVLLVVLQSAWRQGPASLLPWMAGGALLLMLGNSPTSATLTDPRATFWLWLLVGAAAAQAMARPAAAPR